MSIITMPVTDVRQQLNALMDRLDRPVFVTARGRVKAVLLDIDTYNSMTDEIDDARLAADPEIRRVVADIDGAYQRGEMIPIEDALSHAV